MLTLESRCLLLGVDALSLVKSPNRERGNTFNKIMPPKQAQACKHMCILLQSICYNSSLCNLISFNLITHNMVMPWTANEVKIFT